MDKIWDGNPHTRRSLAVVVGMKKWMTTQNQQSNTKKTHKNTKTTVLENDNYLPAYFW